MKASLKFREEQKPLGRAKIPLSILGFPFLSGIAAGESKELRLDLSTAFESGPSFRLSYRPNDSWNPFSVVVKTGVGALGSPLSSPLSMSAEFNLVGRGNPSFFIHFKPRIGDFCIKRTSGSAQPPLVIGRRIGSDHDAGGDCSVNGVETPNITFIPENGSFSRKVANGLPTDILSHPAGGIEGLLSGVEVTARSVLPLRNRMAVKFHWGVRIPAELRTTFMEYGGRKNPTAGLSLRKLPLLVMSKISIEHVPEVAKTKGRGKSADEAGGAADVAEACFSVCKQLEELQAENGMLRQAVEELRAEFRAGKVVGPVNSGQFTSKSTNGDGRDGKGRESEGRSVGKGGATGKNGGRRGDGKGMEFVGKAAQEDVSEELKKALMGTTGAGI